MGFIDALKARRSNYKLTNQINISDDELIDFLKEMIKYTPSAFNSQSQRMVLLLGNKHELFWDHLIETMKDIVKEEQLKKTVAKIEGFKAGHGTILFFDDLETTQGLMKKFPLYKDNFKKWSIEQNGMLQSNVWVGLKSKEIGASLQHYDELVETFVREEFKIPETWILKAQMPFGNITESEAKKDKIEIDKRFKVYQ